MTRAIRIGWSDKFATGIAEIDAQHRTLVQLIDALGEKYSNGAVATAAALDTLHELERYTIHHFATEERLMAEHGVDSAALQHHRQVHQEFIKLLQQLWRLVQASPDDVVGQLLAFLVRWLVCHICGEDRRMAHGIRARQTGVPAASDGDSKLEFDISLTAMVSELYAKLGTRSLEVAGLNARLQEELAHSRQLEAELRASEARWKKALAASTEGVWDWNIATGSVRYSTPRTGSANLDESPMLHVEAAWWGRVHPDDMQRMLAERDCCLVGEAETFACEFRLRNDDGGYHWVLSKGMVIDRDVYGQPTRMIGTLQDIAARKHSEAAVERLAHFDALTDLPNRVLFRQHAEQALANARRNAARVAMLYLDIDQFKPINDRHGHDAGDALLRELAQRVCACLRPGDIVCRQGGDEFLVLLADIGGDAEAAEIAARINAAVARVCQIEALTLQVTTSIGVGYFPDHGQDFDTLVRSADAAMYAAKAVGGNRALAACSGRDPICLTA